jgi:multicomponent Na+:H+ antiporter subunit E
MRAVLIRGAGFAFLWWVLAEGRPEAWGLGLVAAVAGCVLSFRLLPPRREGISLAGLLAFAAFFLWHSARGGLQVAALALRPRPDLAPTLLELPLSLAPGAPRVLMTAAIGLMPGTLGVCLEGDRLRLHVLDERLPAAAEAQALEKCIARVFAP